MQRGEVPETWPPRRRLAERAVKIHVRAGAALSPSSHLAAGAAAPSPGSPAGQGETPAAPGAGSCLTTMFCSKSGHPATELSIGAVFASTPNHIPWTMPAIR